MNLSIPAFFTLLLLLPVSVLLARNGSVMSVPSMVLSAVGVALLLYAIALLLRPRFSRLAGAVAAVLLLSALFVRTLLAFVYDFSGKGFDSAFFLHINRTSLAVGWFEYRRELILVALLAFAIAAACFRLVARQRPATRRLPLALLPMSAALVWLGAASAPEVDLATAWLRYTRTGEPAGDAGTLRVRERASALLEPLRGRRPLPVERSRIEAATPAAPLNLVLVYLESFNEMLTGGDRYPGLTPRIDEFKARYHAFPRIHSSAYLTIEGLANSQCGTLVDMTHANNSLITAAGRLPLLPCLGDVLRKAGYYQVYLGGAPLDFAGKGPFLREHGYDETWGFEHWEDRGYEAVANWGLADDALFDEALATIRELHGRKRPFSVTLLTLGTHLPGFVYDGCPRYSAEPEQRFLNAVHCTDHLFGEFVDALANAGVLEDTVLFAQADHGVFQNPDMRALFGDAVPDTRLVTLVAAPGDASGARLEEAVGRAGSSVDTVATLLDLLGIEHNVEFVLARSHLDDPVAGRYLLSRRADFHDGRQVENNFAVCDDAANLSNVDPPLDNCEKAVTMSAVRDLNRTYADLDPGGNFNRVCDLAASVALDGESGAARITWGKENLSRRFHYRGKPFAAGERPGVYAVLLDAHDNVRNALFFAVDNEYDLWRLKRVVEANEGAGRALFASLIDRQRLAPSHRRLWPRVLDRGQIVYGAFGNDGFDVELEIADAGGLAKFVPGSCDGGARRVRSGTGAL
ncbi:MAG: LTA synthase family protein [Proteobacteria bacterium]|nr:MAG: LTA synthase family protein [Pseudomonadota bacterium]